MRRYYRVGGDGATSVIMARHAERPATSADVRLIARDFTGPLLIYDVLPDEIVVSYTGIPQVAYLYEGTHHGILARVMGSPRKIASRFVLGAVQCIDVLATRSGEAVCIGPSYTHTADAYNKLIGHWPRRVVMRDDASPV
jgi:hypothetical protein